MICKNCHTTLNEQDEYCRNCGAKIIRKRLSFKNLFEHLSETFFNYDNKLLRTFIQLFKAPEDVIVGYINGVRKKYINPISFFGLSLTLSGLSIFIIKKFYIQYLDFSGIFEGMQASQNIAQATSGSALEYNSLIYSGFVPLFALISWVVFLEKKYNFTEHIIIYLYSMSLMSVLMVFAAQAVLIIAPNTYLLFSILSWPLMFLYHCHILRRIFKLSFATLLLKSLIFFAIFFIAYIVISILLFIVMVVTGVVNLSDFVPK